MIVKAQYPVYMSSCIKSVQLSFVTVSNVCERRLSFALHIGKFFIWGCMELQAMADIRGETVFIAGRWFFFCMPASD